MRWEIAGAIVVVYSGSTILHPSTILLLYGSSTNTEPSFVP